MSTHEHPFVSCSDHWILERLRLRFGTLGLVTNFWPYCGWTKSRLHHPWNPWNDSIFSCKYQETFWFPHGSKWCEMDLVRPLHCQRLTGSTPHLGPYPPSPPPLPPPLPPHLSSPPTKTRGTHFASFLPRLGTARSGKRTSMRGSRSSLSSRWKCRLVNLGPVNRRTSIS